jgi:hypothetical protein
MISKRGYQLIRLEKLKNHSQNLHSQIEIDQ